MNKILNNWHVEKIKEHLNNRAENISLDEKELLRRIEYAQKILGKGCELVIIDDCEGDNE